MNCQELTISLFSVFPLSELLTFLAIILAFIAYTWSVKRDLMSWKSLFLSLKADLENQEPWIGSEYHSYSYYDKNSYSPHKVIFPLSFESLSQIIKKGVSELEWISKPFLNNLSFFQERVDAFNSLILHLNNISSADPVNSQKLFNWLVSIGMQDDCIQYCEFKKSLENHPSSHQSLWLLATMIRTTNEHIHIGLIGNHNSHKSLNYLYYEITPDLDNIIENFDKRSPWFVRYEKYILFISLMIYILLSLLVFYYVPSI